MLSETKNGGLKRVSLIGLALLTALVWIFILILWIKLSLHCLLISAEGLAAIPAPARFLLELPHFLKVFFVLSIVLLQGMSCVSKRLRDSERLLLCLFSFLVGIVVCLCGYFFLILPLLSYNQTLHGSLVS